MKLDDNVYCRINAFELLHAIFFFLFKFFSTLNSSGCQAIMLRCVLWASIKSCKNFNWLTFSSFERGNRSLTISPIFVGLNVQLRAD